MDSRSPFRNLPSAFGAEDRKPAEPLWLLGIGLFCLVTSLVIAVVLLLAT